MKKYMIYCIFVLFGFTIFGCGKVDKAAQPNKQSSENVSENVSENKNELDKEDILSAFRFWVNKMHGFMEIVSM